MRVDQIEKYTQLIPASAVLDLAQEMMQTLDMTHFTYDFIHANSDRLILSNAPEWINHYFSEKHHLTKRMRTNTLCDGFHFVDWADLYDYGINKARHDFKLPYGFTLLSNSKNGQEMFHFGCNRNNYTADQYRAQMDNLKSFILWFREHAKGIKKQMPVLQFSNEPEDYRFKSDPIAADPLDNIAIKRCYLDGSNIYLTCREIEIIQYLAKGLHTHEIADLLGVSNRTLESHTNNIKLKFSCTTLFQLGLKLKGLDTLGVI